MMSLVLTIFGAIIALSSVQAFEFQIDRDFLVKANTSQACREDYQAFLDLLSNPSALVQPENFWAAKSKACV
jgi:hypothetical protein